MKLSDLHARLLGAWQGEKRLWMEGEGGPVFTSASRLVVTPVAKGSFLSVTYSWAFDGKAQEGLLIVGKDNAASRLHASAERLIPGSAERTVYASAERSGEATGPARAHAGMPAGRRLSPARPARRA